MLTLVLSLLHPPHSQFIATLSDKQLVDMHTKVCYENSCGTSQLSVGVSLRAACRSALKFELLVSHAAG